MLAKLCATYAPPPCLEASPDVVSLLTGVSGRTSLTVDIFLAFPEGTLGSNVLGANYSKTGN